MKPHSLVACHAKIKPCLFKRVIKLRIPVRAAALRRQVQHQPERIQVWGSTRILSGVCHRSAHLAAVDLADDSIALVEDAEAGDIGVVSVDVGASVFAGAIGEERQISEAALILIIEEALDRRTGRDGNGNALAQVGGNPVPGADERRAHGTRRFALRAVHHAVNQERGFVTEKTREAEGARF